jgi:DNA-binding CsgD family transcriptional regulator
MWRDFGIHDVVLCDWRGHCVWTSAPNAQIKVGEQVWKYLSPDSQEQLKSSIGKVVALRETLQFDVLNQRGERIKGWLWPLDSPEMAVCILGVRVPPSLMLLTERERECLELLAQGISTQQIARQLDVSLSTVHTHMKHVRTKLSLPNIEALISFAARYCYPTSRPLGTPSEESA